MACVKIIALSVPPQRGHTKGCPLIGCFMPESGFMRYGSIGSKRSNGRVIS